MALLILVVKYGHIFGLRSPSRALVNVSVLQPEILSLLQVADCGHVNVFVDRNF